MNQKTFCFVKLALSVYTNANTSTSKPPFIKKAYNL